MMTNPVETIIDVETNEVVTRELTAEEIAELAAEGEKIKAEKLAELEAIQTAKSVLLNKLGITEEEAKLLLS
jgi:AmiR/NasT family two-component response regulator